MRCELESGPRQFLFSGDGKFIYLMYEIKNVIDVFTYEYEEATEYRILKRFRPLPPLRRNAEPAYRGLCNPSVSEGGLPVLQQCRG